MTAFIYTATTHSGTPGRFESPLRPWTLASLPGGQGSAPGCTRSSRQVRPEWARASPESASVSCQMVVTVRLPARLDRSAALAGSRAKRMRSADGKVNVSIGISCKCLQLTGRDKSDEPSRAFLNLGPRTGQREFRQGAAGIGVSQALCELPLSRL